ncbi:uncharacterized protein [Clytia hemisphaerica]|uniref:MANSC domain-containing protein n=1 Tax=Clytia hemisphaerica TaxID=252671 RepID=A0A7M5UZD6_9CNID
MEALINILIILTLYCYLLLAQECPQPKVRKRTIIRSSDSIRNGADPIGQFSVVSARECYQKCCDKELCDVAVMHYKQHYTDDGREVMDKICYLFDCKNPSVCLFDAHSRYAIIEIPKLSRKTSPQKTDIQPTQPIGSTSTSNIIEQHHEEGCLPGVPVAMCSSNPCKDKICEQHTNAVCKPSYCGGCFATFYDAEGNQLTCSVLKKEEVIMASPDYEETPEDTLAAPGILKATTKPTGDDPYFNGERRTWVDGKKPGNLINATSDGKKHALDDNGITEEKVIVVNNTFMSVPLLIALCICLLLIVGLIYRFKFAARGKPKKVPVDDGDYLINGMYL